MASELSTGISVPQPAAVPRPKLDSPGSDIEDKSVGVGNFGHAEEVRNRPVSKYAHISSKETLKLFWRPALFCFMAAYGACNDGYQISLMGQLNANPGFVRQLGTIRRANGTLALNAQHIGAWGGAYNAGYIISQLVCGYPNDRFGRRPTMYILLLFLWGCTLIEMFAKDWKAWLGAKILGGIGFGLGQATINTYISELAPTALRGPLIGCYQLFTALGQFAAAAAVKILADSTPLLYLRAVYSEWAVSGIFFILLVFLPESPRYYAKKRQHEKAKKTMTYLAKSCPGYDVEHEYAVICDEIQEGEAVTARQKGGPWVALFRGVNLRRTIISLLPITLQPLLGTSMVFSQTSYFFQQAGLKDPFGGTIAVYTILVGFVFFSFFMVNRFGRRPLLLGSSAVCIVSLLILGVLGTLRLTKSVSNAIISFMGLWVAAYALGAGPLAFTFLVETSTLDLRAKTTGVAAGLSGAFKLIFDYCTPLMVSPDQGAGWRAKTGFFFAGTGAIGWALCYFVCPETKNRSFQELDELFARHVPARKFASTEVDLNARHESTVEENKRGDV